MTVGRINGFFLFFFRKRLFVFPGQNGRNNEVAVRRGPTVV